MIFSFISCTYRRPGAVVLTARTGPVAMFRMSGYRILLNPVPGSQDQDSGQALTGVPIGFRCAGESSSQNAFGSFCTHPL